MHMGISQKRSDNPKNRLENLYTTLTKGNTLWRSDKAKERGYGHLGAVNFGKANI